MRPALLALLVLALAACPSGDSDGADAGAPDAELAAADAGLGQCPAGQRRLDAEGTCVKVGWSECAEGFAADPSGWGCAPVLPGSSCPAGSFPVLGDTACRPVGVGACPAGFEIDESGYGCAPVLPAAACTGATREALGSESCLPLGDCAAAFPPAGATVFVDDSYTAAQLDSTHFATLTEALAAAADGATIAVEEGSYAGGLVISRPVTILGRCAEKVVLQGTLDGTTGIKVTGAAATIGGLAIKGFDRGVLATGAASVEVRDCLLDANRNLGAVAAAAGTSLALRRDAIRGTLVTADGKYGDGAAVITGATMVVEDCALVGNHTAGVFAQDADTLLTLTRTVVSGTGKNQAGYWGYGVELLNGPVATLTDSAILGGSLAGLDLATATASVTGTTISGTAMGLDSVGNQIGAGVINQYGELAMTGSTVASCERHGLYLTPDAVATLEDSVVYDVRSIATDLGLAVAVGTGSTLTASGVALVKNSGIALILQDGAQATLSDSLIQDSQPVEGRWGAGFGIAVRAASSLQATRVALLGNAATAVSIADTGSAMTGEALVIAETQIAPMVDLTSRYGLGIRLVDGSLNLTRSLVDRCASGGVMVGYPGAVAHISDSLVRDTRPSEDGSRGYGFAVLNQAELVLERSGIVGNRTAALESWTDCTLTFSQVLVAGTKPDDAGDFGNGLIVEGGTATLTDVALQGNARTVFVALDEAKVTLSDSLVRGVGRDTVLETNLGHGVVIDRSTAVLKNTTVEENPYVGVLIDSGAAALSGCLIERNKVAVNLWGDSTLTEAATAPETLGPKEVVVTADTSFQENVTRVGLDEAPLPATPGAF